MHGTGKAAGGDVGVVEDYVGCYGDAEESQACDEEEKRAEIGAASGTREE